MIYKPVYFREQDPIEEEDNRLTHRPFDFAAPIRTGVKVTPLFGGIPTYAAMAKAIRGARRFVYLSGWTLEQSQKVLGSGPRWVDLLQQVALKADVRVLLSDLDPIGNHSRHGINWSTYRELIALQQKLPAKRRSALQVFISLHSLYVDLNLIPTALAALLVPQALTKLRAETKDLLKNPVNKPLLWRNLRQNAKTGQLELAPDSQLDLRIYPASHHQKFCVVDGVIGFAGGIDIANLRAIPDKWRDIHVMLEGTIVGDLEAAFVERWNRERVRFGRFLEKATLDLETNIGRAAYRLPKAELITGLAVVALEPAKSKVPPAPPGKALAQMRRTVTRASHLNEDLEAGRVSTSLVPLTRPLLEVLRTYEHAIGAARKFVYIENQYVRDPRIENWLASRMRSIDTLCAVIVVPKKVEEKDEVFTPHGNFRQSQIVENLRKAFPGRFDAFQVRAFRPYLHSKVLIVDDVFAVIGSANANARSFGLDSELDIAWHDLASVHAFRLQLWGGLLDMAPADVNKTPLEKSVGLFAKVARAGTGIISRYKPLPPCATPRTGKPCEALNPLLDLPLAADVM